MSLKNKVALITGGGSGIGRASAKLLAAEGMRVGLLGHTREDLEETASMIDGDTLILDVDIADDDAMREAVARLANEWGRLDMVFANAGVNGTWAPIDELTPEEWRNTVDINLNGTYLTLHHTVPLLKRQGGSIIITSSINGTTRFSAVGATAYASTKAAQLAMAKMLAFELAPFKIRVNVICPGAVDTSIEEGMDKRGIEGHGFPAEYPEGEVPIRDGEPGESEQVADLVRFLTSDESTLITGTPIWIDGGQSLMQG